jgi:hypothetical protein
MAGGGMMLAGIEELGNSPDPFAKMKAAVSTPPDRLTQTFTSSDNTEWMLADPATIAKEGRMTVEQVKDFCRAHAFFEGPPKKHRYIKESRSHHCHHENGLKHGVK